MRECIICGHSEYNEFAECPICGCEDVQVISDSKESRTLELEFIKEYTAQILEAVSVSFRSYSYKEEENGGNLKLDQTFMMLLAEGKQLKRNIPIWYEEQFASVERDIELELEVININGEKKERTIEITNPPKTELWRIGLMLKDELMIQILVGDQSSYATSKLISLL